MFKDFIELKLGFKSSRVDPNMHYRRNIRSDGSPYYDLLLVYVDGVLVISHDPEVIMKAIGKTIEVALYLIFHYLSKNIKKRLVMDPYHPLANENFFNI